MKYVVAQVMRIEHAIFEVNDLAIVMPELESPLLKADLLKQLVDGCEKLRAVALKLNKRLPARETAI